MGDGEVWRWAALATAVLIQAAAGTNFNFPAYSTSLKAALGASQVGLNGLALASDLGKVLGWSAGVAALRLPLPAVVAVAAGMGLLGTACSGSSSPATSLSNTPRCRSQVFILCLMAGCSICWFNTVCFALCTRAFPSPATAPSAGFYALLATALPGHHPSGSSYLLLSATIPLLASAVALPPALRFSSPGTVAADHGCNDDESEDGVFLLLLGFAVLAGVHLLVLPPPPAPLPLSASSSAAAPFSSSFLSSASGVGWAHPELSRGSGAPSRAALCQSRGIPPREALVSRRRRGRTTVAGEGSVVRAGWILGLLPGLPLRGTVGLVYSNNLGQIGESQGRGGESTAALVGLYSSCSFFGRLLASVPDLLAGEKREWNRENRVAGGGLAPMPAAFFLLAGWGNCGGVLPFCTAAVALSSGFVFAAAVAVTAELFGAESVGVNHNILVTNIPLGSLIYGLLAALLYDTGAGSTGAGGGAATPRRSGCGAASRQLGYASVQPSSCGHGPPIQSPSRRRGRPRKG
ncbi:unnamed protein product [Spirodela intermedia]|uniref:Uncharacterized protein n=1 Tax=Spirodela intermedia TaxID=51605 RepID=A0A7I8INY3_SPIIN|nr:unnamed protein product [Spirodela intermedia]CAA6659657.1 unnamed protein product [Spirodela intermedia]